MNGYDLPIDILTSSPLNIIILLAAIAAAMTMGVSFAIFLDWLSCHKSREESDEKEKCPICERRTVVDMICYNCNHEFFYEEHESGGQILSARSIKISYFNC